MQPPSDHCRIRKRSRSRVVLENHVVVLMSNLSGTKLPPRLDGSAVPGEV